MKKRDLPRRPRHQLEQLESRVLYTTVASPLLAGDVNRDGKVDIVDLSQIAQKWQQPAAAPLDQNGDGIVDIVDYTTAALHWQQTLYNGYTVVADGVTNVWVPDPVDSGAVKWTAVSSDLYGSSGKPTLNDIQAGSADDSYLLGALGALGTSQPAKIQNAISDDGTGWAVYFDGSLTGRTSMVIHVSRDFSADFQIQQAGAGVWWQVVEKAYAFYRTFNGTTSVNSFASLEGGSATTVWQDFGETSTLADYATQPLNQVIAQVQSALAADKPVLFNTLADSPLMTPSHTYTILSMTGTATSGSITTYDSDGFYDFWTMDEVLSSGLGFIIGS